MGDEYLYLQQASEMREKARNITSSPPVPYSLISIIDTAAKHGELSCVYPHELTPLAKEHLRGHGYSITFNDHNHAVISWGDK